MILGIDPKVDYAFKHLFGRESTRPLLIDLLESVLYPTAGPHIRELMLLNPFNPKEALDDKLSILDIKARDDMGRQFNIEMQMLLFKYYRKRILYYWSKLHQQQFLEGQDYHQLNPTISISFLDHLLIRDTDAYHLRFRLMEVDQHIPFSEDVEFHIFQLPNFQKSAEELATPLDLWLYFLRHAEKMDIDAPPPALRHPLFARALEELKMLNQTDLERERYESRRKAQLDYNSGMNEVRREGREEGREEGMQIGTIRLCQQILKRPATPKEQLAALPPEELAKLAAELQALVLAGR